MSHYSAEAEHTSTYQSMLCKLNQMLHVKCYMSHDWTAVFASPAFIMVACALQYSDNLLSAFPLYRMPHVLWCDSLWCRYMKKWLTAVCRSLVFFTLYNINWPKNAYFVEYDLLIPHTCEVTLSIAPNSLFFVKRRYVAQYLQKKATVSCSVLQYFPLIMDHSISNLREKLRSCLQGMLT